ncbi:pyruvate carboxylase [Flavobacterium sp. GT3R68]|uniref:pyruvate carboxylase n=1 Tax=Flavobacterium sp. GT3R68 TaxID=2594437 RepID=UPI000F87E424|nr:pyruvate carboxylase [Flavobacterium sp. GT3R68]RTY86781.1 pyruvate carboxylase [Flavobacterium sp. GSN2]TRW89385.1 pyruvate carboxylase [Flavobacterium sp. GT3R68]
MQTISKLLVANRGEIALRIFRAATELKIKTVGIYTFEDRYSLHRYKADEAYQIGRDSEPLKPYLDIDEIVKVAKRVGADAIHPGYGFLAENVEFAAKCIANNILWVGPDPSVMAQLGDKVAAKKIAIKAKVPIIADSKVNLTDFSIAKKEAKAIGFPLMLKAAFGGGGRGMRVVRDENAFEALFNEAKREAKTAFGDDTIFIEKFIETPKHIEVQLLGDNYGNIVHLFERDCSIQRRFQKVVEIAPAPNLKAETKEKLYNYALAIAKEVNYNNAGTVEFLIDKDENIYFIEVNPRIQVEHTITEEVTGIDIVRSQILIACGHELSSPGIYILGQESLKCHGFAIQCRITTEDPENDFTPDYGTIIAYRNAGGYGIRIDEGSSYPGVKISPFFDSMLVKVTARGRTLKGTSQRLLRTLNEFTIRGVKTNIPFLENLIVHPDFQNGTITVNFIADNPSLTQIKQKADSGTKNLKYIANTIVNGNPDVKFILPEKKFLTPKLPDSSSIMEHPRGTKQLLDELKPKDFCQWIKDQNQILFTDCTMRDAHQSLLATRARTIDMLPFAESFTKHFPHMFSMEVWGGATFDVAMRFLNENPWDRLELIRKAMPNVLLQMLIRGANAVGYTAYPDNLVEKFIEVSAEKGIDVFRIFDSLNSIDNMKTSINAVLHNTNSIAEVSMGYSGDILNPDRPKFSLNYYLDLAKRIEDTGAHILCIKDMAGLLKPYAAEKLITELKKSIDIPIHLHTHDTAGIQSATYLKAVEAGVDIIDVALSSMSGLTSQPNFNVFVEALKGTPRHSEFDIHTLNAYSNYWEDVREYYYPFESDLKSSTAEVYNHEIPGGQYSNLKPQAYSLGLENRMTDIKQAYEDANHLLGDIIKVTPSSKVVGDLAMFMVNSNLSKQDVLDSGHTLSFPSSVKGMLMGELGQPEGGWPKDFQKMVLKDEVPFVDLPNKHLSPVDFEKEYQEFKVKFSSTAKMTDFLSYKFYPKVFEDYFKANEEWGNVSVIPSTTFFYGLKPNEEIIIHIAGGKIIIVKFLYKSEPDEKGMRTVYFKLNGQTRAVEIRDKSVKIVDNQNQKANGEKEIGSPLPGMLSKIWVKENDVVTINQPLFTIEAMKMENTVLSNTAGTISRIVLRENGLVELGDLIIEYK